MPNHKISETIVLLGIPISNLDMEETIEHIFSMIDTWKIDGRARQISTVNVDFVVNTLTWKLSRVRHPELLDILMRSDLVTPDAMPIVLASRLLGTPLKERVTGADLVPRLAQESAKRGLFKCGAKYQSIQCRHIAYRLRQSKAGGMVRSQPAPAQGSSIHRYRRNI